MAGDTGPKLFLGMLRFHEPHKDGGDGGDDGAEVDSTVRAGGIASGAIFELIVLGLEYWSSLESRALTALLGWVEWREGGR